MSPLRHTSERPLRRASMIVRAERGTGHLLFDARMDSLYRLVSQLSCAAAPTTTHRSSTSNFKLETLRLASAVSE